MSVTDLETYAGQVARLKRDYIQDLGEHLAFKLRLQTTKAVAYEPGNGTRYELVFLPVARIEQTLPHFVPEGIRNRDGDFEEGWTVVAQVNGSAPWAHTFNLTPGNTHHASYVGPHIKRGLADASALTALFRAICGVPIEDND